MCITKTFHITYHGSSYSRYEYISRYNVTYITYMQIIMKKQVSMQDENELYMMWYYLVEGSYNNSDSSEAINI